ncbi:MAG: hypothetical protein JWQ27_1073 [Ferruginibacter sp.]|nr:hypothetical protein [Ferruginibacter sp.]
MLALAGYIYFNGNGNGFHAVHRAAKGFHEHETYLQQSRGKASFQAEVFNPDNGELNRLQIFEHFHNTFFFKDQVTKAIVADARAKLVIKT